MGFGTSGGFPRAPEEPESDFMYITRNDYIFFFSFKSNSKKTRRSNEHTRYQSKVNLF